MRLGGKECGKEAGSEDPYRRIIWLSGSRGTVTGDPMFIFLTPGLE